jgi:recombination protein RecT
MANELSVIQRVRGELDKREGEFRALLPSHIPAGILIRTAQTAMILNEELQQCTQKSLIIACTKAAETGLPPDGVMGALVPYNVKVSKKNDPDRWEKQAKFVPMIEGMRDLVRRSEQVKDWKFRAVYSQDAFQYIDGDIERLTHIPAFAVNDRLVKVYSIAYLENGQLSRCVMTVEEVELIRRRAKYPNPAWNTDYTQMALKTVGRRHYKALPRAKDDLARHRISGAIHALDDAEGVIELPRPVDVPRLSLEEAASQRMRDAAGAIDAEHEDEAFDYDAETGEIIEPPAAEAEKPKRGRKTTADKLAEVEAGRQERMKRAEEKKAPAQEQREAAEEQQEAAAEIDIDALKSAYTWGWNDRLAQGEKAGQPRTPEFASEAEGQHWMFGWGAMDQTIAIGNAPIDDERSQALLERALSKRYGA